MQRKPESAQTPGIIPSVVVLEIPQPCGLCDYINVFIPIESPRCSNGVYLFGCHNCDAHMAYHPDRRRA